MQPKIIGLSGSIASGKNFIANIFSKFHIMVFDADLTVHQLLQQKFVIKQIQQFFPSCVIEQKIDRKILGQLVFYNKKNLEKLEKILHPLVRKAKQKFLLQAKRKKQKLAVLNVPLLLEKSKHYPCHVVLSIIANKSTRFTRFLHRNTQNNNTTTLQHKFEKINNKQTNNFTRCVKADFILFNHFSFFLTKRKIFNIIKKIK
jgi:dephospho-CoA kinase